MLVVEDDPLLRALAVDLIEDAGFEVVEAADAGQTVEILERRLDVRIVFIDFDTSGSMDGPKLVKLIRDRWPPIKLVVTSGTLKPSQLALPADVRFLAKPYRDREVIERISRLAN